MGSSLTPIGIGGQFSPDGRVTRARGDNRAGESERKSGQRGFGDFFAPGGAGSSQEDSANGLQGGAFYEVAAGLIFQQQLLFSGAPGAATDTPSSSNQNSAAPSSSAPSSQATASSGSESGGNGSAFASVALGLAVSIEAALGVESPSAGGNSGVPRHSGQTAASTGSTSTEIPSSATVKQEEAQLQQALQELGLSPAAIQQFTYDGQLLAQVAPGMFQEFLSYVLELAKAAEPSLPAASAAAATNAAIAQTATAPAPSPQSVVLEFGSAQATEAEITITPNQNGGETISLSAASASVTYAGLQTTSSSQSSTNPPQPSTPSTPGASNSATGSTPATSSQA